MPFSQIFKGVSITQNLEDEIIQLCAVLGGLAPPFTSKLESSWNKTHEPWDTRKGVVVNTTGSGGKGVLGKERE